MHEITSNCRFGKDNLDKQRRLMAYAPQLSTQKWTIEKTAVYTTTLRVIMADKIKNPLGHSDCGDNEFLNTSVVETLAVPLYKVKIAEEFLEWYKAGQPCRHIGSSDVLLIGSLAAMIAVNYKELIFAVVKKYSRLAPETPWSKITVMTPNVICPLTMMCIIKIGSLSNYIRQISSMIDFKVPQHIQFQMGLPGTGGMTERGKTLTPQSNCLDGLNESQKPATEEIRRLHGTDPGIYCIQGAPGTGKTRTIVKLIVSLINDGMKVWVCAPSNNAVEVILLKLIAERDVSCDRLLRISAQLEPAESVQDFLLSNILAEKESQHTTSMDSQSQAPPTKKVQK
ncbi:hypothetical protein GEMRC1_002374 [Eukaryota sp. GEM-RC1]